jgi:hypothetical protein
MTIFEITRQAFYYARTCRSLWLFGFIVGVASGGSNGGGGGGDGNAGGAAAVGRLLHLSVTQTVAMALAALAVVVAAIVLRFVSEGALIEGVVRARRGGTMSVREGFRAGWAHLGVLVRIGLAYVAATMASIVVLAIPAVLAFRAMGPVGGAVLAIPAVLVAIPWLVTLALVQAFAFRIAVIENRHALDAIAKARLFLHGRLVHGLRLLVATFLGTFAIGLAAAVVLVPVVLLLVGLVRVLRVAPVIVLAGMVLLPAACVLTAVLGTFRSSVWTLGYLSQVDS